MRESINFDKIASLLPGDVSSTKQYFETSLAEAHQTLNLLVGLELSARARVLEVGSGYGLASVCLAMMGLDVTALEPGGIGFEDNRRAAVLISQYCGVTVTHIGESVESFDFSELEKFSLIISNNVLEHIPNVDKALSNLYPSLLKDGFMIHSCANYVFPFEPHFGIPLVPLKPSLTRFFLPKSVSESGLWKSLNFVTARRVRLNATRHGMTCQYRRGTMSTSIQRLKIDEQFASRHQAITRLVNNPLIFKILIKVLSLPTWLATPMDFVICHQSYKDDENIKKWIFRE